MWRVKEGRVPPLGGGVVCTQHQFEFQTATLACETAPLHLDIEGNCGADRMLCIVKFRIDGREFRLTGNNHPVGEIWASFVDIPVAARRDFLEALAAARSIDVAIEDKPAWSLPVDGLDETVATLLGACVAHTS